MDFIGWRVAPDGINGYTRGEFIDYFDATDEPARLDRAESPFDGSAFECSAASSGRDGIPRACLVCGLLCAWPSSLGNTRDSRHASLAALEVRIAAASRGEEAVQAAKAPAQAQIQAGARAKAQTTLARDATA